MRIYMQIPAMQEQLPRFYQMHLERDLLEGWLLVKEWGHVGSAGRIKQEHYDTIEDAEAALITTRDNQIKRGYQVVFVQGQTEPR